MVRRKRTHVLGLSSFFMEFMVMLFELGTKDKNQKRNNLKTVTNSEKKLFHLQKIHTEEQLHYFTSDQ